MIINLVWEHNGSDTLLYADNLPGAYSRGESLDAALRKLPEEVRTFLRWRGDGAPESVELKIVQEKASSLTVSDADSDVIFDSERLPLTPEEYAYLKALALKSAGDFHRLYESVPDKDAAARPRRESFYGAVPATAREMYGHTKNVNGYYFGELGIDDSNDGTILSCREKGFELLEATDNYLTAGVFTGSYDEDWSLRKLLRRFIWHDRIHARAMYRLAKALPGGAAEDVFAFEA